MRTTATSGGWYYGEKTGPVSTARLKELLASGELPPRQAVWRKGSQSSGFVPAEAACGSVGEPTRLHTLEPVS